MRSKNHLFIAINLLLFKTALATSVGNSPDDGFLVKLSTPVGIAHQSGTSTQISGHVSLLGKKNRSVEQALTNHKLRLRFFYPDYLTEITDKVTVDSQFRFTYSTPLLLKGSSPSFIAQVSSDQDKSDHLKKVKSKIDLRVQKLNESISSLQAQNKNPKLIEELKALRAKLLSIALRTQAVVDADPNILAHTKLPIQIDNQTADSAFHSTIMGKYRFSVEYDLGSAIDGLKTNVKARIVSLKNPTSISWGESGYWRENFANNLWQADFVWNGQNVHQVNSAKLAGGESIEFSYTTSRLRSTDRNIFEISLFKLNASGVKTGVRWGELEALLPVAADNTVPKWLAGSIPDGKIPYVRNAELISARVKDEFGRVDGDAFTALLTGTLVNGSTYSKNLLPSLNLSTSDEGRLYNISGEMNPLEEGDYTLKMHAEDLAGNNGIPEPYTANFIIDRTVPVITLGKQDNILTNDPIFFLPVYIEDRNPVTTTVIHNWLTAYNTPSKAFTAQFTLAEGPNVISVHAIDGAGNMAASKGLNNVVLDTIEPVLSDISPSQNEIVPTLTFIVSGKSNEKLSSVEVSTSEADAQQLSLSTDQKSFTGAFTLPAEGTYSLIIRAKDLAGNITIQTVPIEIVLKLLFAELITVSPNADGRNLDIIGSKRAARPGITVKASGSFLNSETFEANSDGSFVVTLKPFTKATLTATDSRINKTESVDVYFGSIAPTLLSGRVLNTDGFALKGVTVSLKGNNYKVVTDENGVFSFPNGAFGQGVIPTGDQLLAIDGTTIPVPTKLDPNGVPVPTDEIYFKYPLEHIGITIGLNQSNVIPFPIHLQGVPSNTPVVDNSNASVSVSAANDPDVRLDIPAGSAKFPDGTSVGQIFLKRNPADSVVLPVPQFSVPDTAIHLEPSGLKFTERVHVTLPNENNLPPGVKLVIMSMNPTKGIWEVDGVAEVTTDGSRIETLPGQGISHFSTIYASPLGPKVSPVGGQEIRGADTFNGSLSTKVNLPSMTVFGEQISPTLHYSSSSARPTAMVSNLFEIPKQEVEFKIKGGDGFLVKTETNVRMWYQPNKIVGRFDTAGFLGKPVEFAGPPNKVVLSYATELGDQDTGEYLPSGVYPFTSHWDIHLDQITVATTKAKGLVPSILSGGAGSISDRQTEINSLEAFPADVTGAIIIENQRKSPVGVGWKISGIKALINPEANKVLVDEGDGSYTTYAINNTINTIANPSVDEVDLSQGVDLSRLPRVAVTRKDGKIAYGDLSSATSDNPLSSFTPVYNPLVLSGGLWANRRTIGSDRRSRCLRDLYLYNIAGETQQLFQTDNNEIVGTSSSHSITSYKSTGATKLSGIFGTAPFIEGSARFIIVNNICTNTPGMTCTYSHADNDRDCSNYQSYGPFPSAGFNDGAIGNVRWNNPKGIISGKEPNTLIVADYGNHRVRKIDLNNNTVSTIAGNGSYNTSGYPSGGDGGPATQAKVYHPNGLVYDDFGNLYISEDGGAIRKVDSLGNITTIIGGATATPNDELTLGSQVALQNPYGMAIDSTRGYLYIAETGANKIKRYYLAGSDQIKSGKVETIAGSSNPQAALGDGGAALNASLIRPTFVSVDNNGNLYIVDSGNNRIRKVNFNFDSTTTLSYQPSSGDSSILVRNPDGTYVRTLRKGIKTYFNPDGTQNSTVDRIGNTTLYKYNGDSESKKLTRIEFPTGQFFNFNYSGNTLVAVVDSASRSTTFTHDYKNNLKVVHFPDNTSRKFEYNSLGLLYKEVDQLNYEKTYTYNEWNRLASIKRQDDSVLIVNDSASATSTNNYTGVEVPKDYGPNEGQAYEGIIDPKSNETKFVKDINGYVSTIVDRAGAKLVVNRDVQGKPLKITRYDKSGTEVSTVNYTYDVNNINPARHSDLLSQTDTATGITMSRTYNDFGLITSETSGRNQTTYYGYDSLTGLLMSVTYPKGNLVEFRYNSLGLITKKIVQNGSSNVLTEYAYNEFGQLIKITDNAGNNKQFYYDLAGNKIKTVETINSTESAIFQYEYDDFNRLIKVISPKNEITSYSYWPTGELAQIIDANDNVTKFEYNSIGKLIKKTDHLNSTYQYTHDANGNLTSETDPSGVVKTFAYNQIDQLVSVTLPDDFIQYEYNTKGDLVLAKNNVSQIEIQLDTKGRATLKRLTGLGSMSDFPVVDIAYEYDKDDNRTGLFTAYGNINYSYDENNYLTRIENTWGDVFENIYDQSGIITQQSRPNGYTKYSYAPSMAVDKIEHFAGGSLKEYTYYLFDQRNNPTQRRTTAGSYDYQYDPNGQVLQATHSSLPQETFKYDSIGNRISNGSTNYTYEIKSQKLIDDGVYLYEYDKSGNIVLKISKDASKEGFKFYYSSKNQLKKVEVLDGTFGPIKREIQYTYDVSGRRIQKSVFDHHHPNDPAQTYTRRYIYDNENIIFEFDGNKNLLAKHTHSPSELDDILSTHITAAGVDQKIAQYSGNFYYLKDSLGSTIAIQDSNGDIKQRIDYATFGNVISIKDSHGDDIKANPVLNTSFTFTGREWDKEAGLYYYRARYYDPNLGRFIQKDPHPGKVNNPITVVNRYTYAGNSPTVFKDPTGKIFGFDDALIILAVTVGVAMGAADVDIALENGITDPEKLFWTFVNGFLTGSATTLWTATTGFWGTVGISALMGGLHNGTNQYIYHGKIVNWDSLGNAFVMGGVSSGLGFGAGWLSGMPTKWKVIGNPVGSSFGISVGANFVGAGTSLLYDSTLAPENSGIPQCTRVNELCSSVTELD